MKLDVDAAGFDFSHDLFANRDLVAQAIASASDAATIARIDEAERPSEWAERNVYIPVGNARPGLIDFSNAPYQRELLDAIIDDDTTRITMQWGAQVGKTTTALCAQAFFVAQEPKNQMMMQPSQGDLKTWLETKFNPLIDANDKLKKLIAKARGRDGVNNQQMKSYPGGFLMFAWSGSPKTMRGRSAPIIVADEVDGYDRTSEGHPVSLLWQRAATFGDDRLLIEISTPTFKGASYIEAAFEQGDQRYFLVPCPDCGEYQRLKWSGVVWDKDGEDHQPHTARYTCEHCGSLWTDDQRFDAINSGHWEASKPFKGHRSYHLSELYSVFVKLAQIVQSFLDKKAQHDLQTFVNVSLAETWEEKGAQTKPEQLIARAETYAAPIPLGGLVLTAGVDMQSDRLELEVVAWGVGESSWSIDYRVLWGDPLKPEVWRDLDNALATTYRHELGHDVPILSACLDTGGEGGCTQSAYEYVRRTGNQRIFAIKGVGGWGRPIVSAPKKTRSRRSRPINLFSVGVDEAKLIVQRRLNTEEGAGVCHFPADRDPEFFYQLCAEKLITRYSKGFPIRSWSKTRPRNEALDCRVYAYAALKIANPTLDKIAQDYQQLAAEPEKTQQTGVIEPKKPRKTARTRVRRVRR